MNKKILVGLSVLGVSVGFWACGDGAIESMTVDDDVALANYSEFNPEAMTSLVQGAMAACEAEPECAAKMEGSTYVPPEQEPAAADSGATPATSSDATNTPANSSPSSTPASSPAVVSSSSTTPSTNPTVSSSSVQQQTPPSSASQPPSSASQTPSSASQQPSSTSQQTSASSGGETITIEKGDEKAVTCGNSFTVNMTCTSACAKVSCSGNFSKTVTGSVSGEKTADQYNLINFITPWANESNINETFSTSCGGSESLSCKAVCDC